MHFEPVFVAERTSDADDKVRIICCQCCRNGRPAPRDWFSDETEKTNYLRTIDMTNDRTPVHYLFNFLTHSVYDTTMFPFNNLPIELQREIFVVAARSEQGSALRLVLVARRIRLW